ncbi:MAG: hypothetical protein QOJ09_1395 [Actinomycetota bacterium]|nr:hypothetical protein [Actinomycetota bacterium]
MRGRWFVLLLFAGLGVALVVKNASTHEPDLRLSQHGRDQAVALGDVEGAGPPTALPPGDDNGIFTGDATPSLAQVIAPVLAPAPPAGPLAGLGPTRIARPHNLSVLVALPAPRRPAPRPTGRTPGPTVNPAPPPATTTTPTTAKAPDPTTTTTRKPNPTSTTTKATTTTAKPTTTTAKPTTTTAKPTTTTARRTTTTTT